jgi:hypothetical protein
LLGYLNNITSLSQLRYVFNGQKIDRTQAKQKMQAVFRGSKSDDIFNIFWNKFKADFFPTRPNTPQGKIDARNDFN